MLSPVADLCGVSSLFFTATADEVHAETSALTMQRQTKDMRAATAGWKFYGDTARRVVWTCGGQDRLKLTDDVARPDLSELADHWSAKSFIKYLLAELRQACVAGRPRCHQRWMRPS